MTADMLERLRRGVLDEEMRKRLNAYQQAMVQQVATTQYDSTCEVGRQLRLSQEKVVPLPLSEITQKAAKVDGLGEDFEMLTEAAPTGAPRDEDLPYHDLKKRS